MKDLSKIKNIEFLNTKQEIVEEVLFEHSHFDLSDYYSMKQDAALGIITPKEVFSVYAIISHELVCQKLYQLLYENFEEFSSKEGKEWQQQAASYGNIILQFIRDEYLFVWFPKEWNLFQAKVIRSILFQIEDLCLKNNMSLTYCNGNYICHSVEDLLWYVQNETKDILKTNRQKHKKL